LYSLFFEKVVKRPARHLRSRVQAAGTAGFHEDKVIAKIGLPLFFHELGHWFLALLRCGSVIEPAVETAMQVSSAEWALIPSADTVLDHQASLAGMADFHEFYDIVISFRRQAKKILINRLIAQQHGSALI
jgi:hypothetical protein